MENESGRTTEELIEDLDISECIDESSSNQGSSINLRKLLMILKQEYNFSFESNDKWIIDKEIHYYLPCGELYVNCGIDPVVEDMSVRYEDYCEGLMLRAKELGVSLVHRLMSFENVVSHAEEKDRSYADEMAEKSKCRRTKERRIGHIIDKVIEWRKYYSGLVDDKNIPMKYSLEEAAKEVKISKKSLDDYLFQIRFGHRFGFNFNEHYNDKVGVLRDFVRQRKKNDKVDGKIKKINNKIERGDYD